MFNSLSVKGHNNNRARLSWQAILVTNCMRFTSATYTLTTLTTNVSTQNVTHSIRQLLLLQKLLTCTRWQDEEMWGNDCSRPEKRRFKPSGMHERVFLWRPRKQWRGARANEAYYEVNCAHGPKRRIVSIICSQNRLQKWFSVRTQTR